MKTEPATPVTPEHEVEIDRLVALLEPVVGRLYLGPDPIALRAIAATVYDAGWRWITAQRVEAAMNAVPNLGVEAYPPVPADLAAALLGTPR